MIHSVISYEKLLEIFWHVHDPTTLSRGGIYSKGRSKGSLLRVVHPLLQGTQARRGWECAHEEVFLVRGRSRGSRYPPAEPHAPGWSGARGDQGMACSGQSPAHYHL